MKRMYYRILIVWLVGMMILPIQAQPIDQQTALKRARQFMGTKGRQITQRTRSAMTVASEDFTPYYIYNADGRQGYVVVSGDERTPAILGYSEQGSFDEAMIPSNLRSWLQHYADEIALIQKYDMSVPRRTVADCGAPITKELTCLWGQTSPYNLQCPMVTPYRDKECTQQVQDAQQAVVGCAATALAQVLYMWKDEYQKSTVKEGKLMKEIPAREDVVWSDPNVMIDGTRQRGYIKFSDGAIPVGTVIDWAHLLDVYDGEHGTETEINAVAQLSHICGAAMKMSYGSTFGSGSSAEDVGGAIAASKYLGFDRVRVRMQSLYPYQQWLQMLYDELKVSKAVYFTGQSSGGGHGFVIDGYDKEDLFHVNWGWFGNGNESHFDGGFYRLNSLLPVDQGTGGSLINDGFRMSQTFAIGIYPNASEPVDQPAMTVYRFCASESEVEVKDKGCTLSMDLAIQNLTCPVVQNCQVGMCLEGNGSKHYILLSDFSDFETYGGVNTGEEIKKVELTGLKDGTYALYPCYRTSDSDDAWKPCLGEEGHRVGLAVSGTKAVIANAREFVLAVIGSDEQSAGYAENTPITITYRMKVTDGSLHDILKVMAVPIKEGIPDTEKTVVLSTKKEMYYGEKDVEFDLICCFESLPAGDYQIVAQSDNAKIDTQLGTIKVVIGTGIHELRTIQGSDGDTRTYDLQGRPTSVSYKGIVIQKQGNGTKKIMVH